MRALALQVLVLLSLTAGATLLTWKFHPLAPALHLNAEPLGDGEVSVEQALAWEQGAGVLWVDARPEEKFQQRHIPGAILINEFDFDQQMLESYHLITNQDLPVVVYCGSHSCKASTQIAEKLRDKRVPEVYVLKGGWDAWVKQAGGAK